MKSIGPVLAVTSFLLMGCQANEAAHQRFELNYADAREAAPQVLQQEFQSLIPGCLGFLESGQEISPSEMEAFGFNVRARFIEPRFYKRSEDGEGGYDVGFHMTTHAFDENRKLCTFMLNDFPFPDEIMEFAQDALTQKGFSEVAQQRNRAGRAFAKGNQTVTVSSSGSYLSHGTLFIAVFD